MSGVPKEDGVIPLAGRTLLALGHRRLSVELHRHDERVGLGVSQPLGPGTVSRSSLARRRPTTPRPSMFDFRPSSAMATLRRGGP